MAYSVPDPPQSAFAATKVRSQSDSDLLNPTTAGNGLGSLKRNTSMDDMNAVAGGGKRKNFLYRLVRPWKWRNKRRSSKIKAQGGLLPLHWSLLAHLL